MPPQYAPAPGDNGMGMTAEQVMAEVGVDPNDPSGWVGGPQQGAPTQDESGAWGREPQAPGVGCHVQAAVSAGAAGGPAPRGRRPAARA